MCRNCWPLGPRVITSNTASLARLILKVIQIPAGGCIPSVDQTSDVIVQR